MKTVFTYKKLMFVVMAAMAVFTSCTKNEDDYIASSLRSSDWQGKITEYYQNRWGINGSEYSTVMGFESKDYQYTSGRGYELDYKTSSPKENYAFCTFKATASMAISTTLLTVEYSSTWRRPHLQNGTTTESMVHTI